MVRSQPYISLFLPCYNEQSILKNHVKQVKNALDKTKHRYEIIIVDDTSTDHTSSLAKKLSQNKKIRHERYTNGPSRRENLADAFKKAKGKIIIFMDIDLATDLRHLPRLIKEVECGADLATGSRYLRGSKLDRENYRLIISWCYNTTLRVLFGSRMRDHQCGFKAFKKEKLKLLLKKMGYDKEHVRGWFWDAELLIRAQKMGYKIKEFPVRWVRGDQSSFDLKRELKLIPYMLKLRFGGRL